jgi:hypothetical protein
MRLERAENSSQQVVKSYPRVGAQERDNVVASFWDGYAHERGVTLPI